MKSDLFIISRSGWRYILYALAISAIFVIIDFDFFAFVSSVLFFCFLFLFRNPERELPESKEASLISPVDGNVVKIEKFQEGEYSYRVDIESSYGDVGVLRSPFSAEIADIALTNGSRVAKYSKLFLDLNESVELTLCDKEGNSVRLVHRLKRSFAPINLFIHKDQNILQGSRYGFMIDGVTSIYLKEDCTIALKLGEAVKAGETLLATFS